MVSSHWRTEAAELLLFSTTRTYFLGPGMKAVSYWVPGTVPGIYVPPYFYYSLLPYPGMFTVQVSCSSSFVCAAVICYILSSKCILYIHWACSFLVSRVSRLISEPHLFTCFVFFVVSYFLVCLLRSSRSRTGHVSTWFAYYTLIHSRFFFFLSHLTTQNFKGRQGTCPPGASPFGFWYPVDWRHSVLLASDTLWTGGTQQLWSPRYPMNWRDSVLLAPQVPWGLAGLSPFGPQVRLRSHT